ncbi:MAG: ParB/RepB/Spo0J family partition protein [Nitrososphaerota archaeon]
MASHKKFRIVHLDPDKIEIPSVRVTSYFDEETRILFEESIEKVGIMQPLLVLQEGEKYILVDGFNRLQEAKLKGIKKVPCAVIEGTYKDVLLQNLSLNVLRGKVKPTEMMQVISELYNKHRMSLDEIAQLSGLKRDYIEKLLAISTCSEKVILALDDNLISVSHAYEISQVPDHDVQERLLTQTLTYRLSVKDLRDIVRETIKILKQRKEEKPTEVQVQEVKIPTVKCDLCGQEWPIKKVTGLTVCISCHSIALDAIRQKINEIAEAAKLERERQLKMLTEVIEGGEEA